MNARLDAAPGWRPLSWHPLAELFPLPSDDDLQAMAEHIKANGLQVPIVVDKDGVGIDGRTRMRACELAGVEPTFQSLNGHDPVQYIWGANTKRRNMTKGQIAMIAVEGDIVSSNENPNEPRGRGRPSKGIEEAARSVGVNRATITKALFVKEHAPDLVEEVINSTLSLDEAHSKAEQRAKQVEGGKKGGKEGGRGNKKVVTNSSPPFVEPKKTRTKVAEAAGVSEHKASINRSAATPARVPKRSRPSA